MSYESERKSLEDLKQQARQPASSIVRKKGS